MNPIIFNLVTLAISAFLALWLTVPFSRWVAGRVGAIDMPGKNKIHLKPMPRLGGLGILLAFGLALSGFLSTLDIPASVYRQVIVMLTLLPGVAAIGFLDDVRGVREWIKFVEEGIIAIVLISLVDGQIWWMAVIAWLWVVGLINGYNFLDGLDGLAASIAVIHLLVLATMFLVSGNGVLAVVAGTLAMATLGFLRHNWPPATIFMGDAGSLSLGFVTSALSLLLVINEQFSFNAILAVILTASLPLGDVSLTFLRRLVNRRPLLPADRGHFYDQMVDRGRLSKLNAVRLSALMAAAVGGLGVITFALPLPLAIWPFLPGGALLLLAVWHFKISLRWEKVDCYDS